MLTATLAALACLQSGPPEYESRVEPASEEAELAIQGFELADGLWVSLFAAEPRLANPVCLWVDGAGDVLVAETFRHFAGVTDMREHMDWLDDDVSNRTVADRVAMYARHLGDEGFADFERAEERVRWIRDTDGDGRADVDTVFAGGFTDAAAGIGAGLLSYRGDVYYTCIPDLWRLRDTDGNHRADERVKLSTGYGVNVALLGHDLHGLRIGPDGRLYFSCGDRGFHVETEAGTLAHPHTGAVLRCDLDGSGLEVFATGLRNPQELAFNELGDLFTGDNNSDGGDKARWVHVLEGGDSGWRYGYQWLTRPNLRGPWNDEKLWHPHHPGQAAYLVAPIENLADGPSGLAYHPGTGLREWEGHFFLCDFRGDPRYSGIHAFDVEPAGATYSLGEVERLVWNALPTDCDFGPDGSLYFTDWVQGWNKTGKGRVYRVEGEADPRAAEVAEVLANGLGASDLARLSTLLDHADMRVRQEAQFELARRGADGLAVLRSAVEEARRPLLARLHGVWGVGMVAPLEAGAWLARDDLPAEVRAQAARVLGDAPDRARVDDRVRADLLHLLEAGGARERYHAALALGKLRADVPARLLVDFLAEVGESDVALRHAGITALARCGPDLLATLVDEESVDVRVAAVVALRRQRAPEVAIYLGDRDPRVVVEAARAIHDVPIEAALPRLAELAEAPGLEGTALVRRVMSACALVGGEERARSLARIAASGLDPALRAEALEHLRTWAEPPGRNAVTGEWRPVEPRSAAFLPAVVAELDDAGIERAPKEVLGAWIALAAEAGAVEVAPRLATWATSGAFETSVRTAALDALATLRAPELEPTARAVLLDPVPKVRARALELFREVAPGEALPLLEVAAREGEVPVRRAAFRALARLDEPRAAAALAEQLERLRIGRLSPEIALDLVVACEERDDPALAAALAARADERAGAGKLGRYLDGLFGGDPDAGRRLFREKAEVTCLRCHVVEDGEGGRVGPELVGVGRRLTRLQLLESIVDPNGRVPDGWRASVFLTRDDERLEGRVIEEGPDRILLRTGDDELVELDPAEVVSRRVGLSAMPEGLENFLSRREMRDLLAYLADL